MSLAAVLFVPFFLLPTVVVPGNDADEWAAAITIETSGPQAMVEPIDMPEPSFSGSTFQELAEGFRVGGSAQVRIEQHTTIRIVPRPRPVPMPPNLLMDLPGRSVASRMIERNIGKCVPAARIAGVQVERGNRLILFLRDRRVISAELERACRSRDYYSGFYLEQSTDGQLCAGRDTLRSRNGANCKLTRLRQLVEAED